MSIQNLKEKLRDNSAALIISEENRFYFTGFRVSDGFLIVTKNRSVFITDSRYIEAAEHEITDCEVVLQNKVFEQINNILHEQKVAEVLIEAGYMSVLKAAQYKEALSGFGFNYTNELEKYIAELRIIKTHEEKETILCAQRIAERAFDKVLNMVKPGVTERDIAAEMEYIMRKEGADGVSFDTIVVTGVNSSKPHGVPGDTPVASGDFVTMDFGALYRGYHSDTTRTVAVGNVSPEQVNVYDIVLKAQLAGVNALKAGIDAKAADAVCREMISDAGYGEYFGHGTGHGVGVEIHEAPSLSPRSDEKLTAGNVVTIEPGIYLPGKFGVRIEDMLYVTEDGAENLVTLPKTLITL